MSIVIVGKLGNDWGIEGLIARHVSEFVNLRIIDIKEFNLGKFSSDDNFVFIQGRGIDRDLLRLYRGKKVLWNAEFLPYKGFEDNQEALARLYAIEPLEDFDLILNGCPLSTKFLKEIRNLNIEWFPMMGADSLFHRRDCDIPKDTDIGFYGAVSQRRIKIWHELIRVVSKYSIGSLKLAWKQVYGKDLIRFINSCKVVLNIHYSDLLNTESRIYEILGCGVFCLSEPVSYPDLFLDGKHLKIEGEDGFLKAAIDFSSFRRTEAKQIARQGYEYVHDKFGIQKVMSNLIKRIECL